jgi:hypothetical protein
VSPAADDGAFLSNYAGNRMKWQNNNRTASEGVLFVESVVHDHGSIFRQLYPETDIGVVGHIELITEPATGTFVAVQVKSGDTHLADNAREFCVSVDQAQLDYWSAYLVPIVLVCYSPSMKIAAWISIHEYMEREMYHDRTPVTSIRIPFVSEFNVQALNEGIAALADANADRRILIKCADNCLAGDAKQRFQGLSILAAHPDSRDSRTIAFLSRRLLFDDHISVADEAIRTLAYHVGRSRWSGNPNKVEEKALVAYAVDLCRDFTAPECQRLIERIDDESFAGPDAMGERVFDLLSCCEASQNVMEEIAADTNQPMQRRINALYLSYGCDDEELLNSSELADDQNLGDVYRAMYPRDLGSSE